MEMEPKSEETEKMEQPADKRKKMLVGIDLGTSLSAIMSDTGVKILTRSVVGYPKDIISRQMVGEGPFFGQDAIEKKNFLNLCYPLSEGVIRETSKRDYKAALQLIYHIVDQARDKSTAEVSGIIGIPARASQTNKELLLNIAKEVITTALVVSEPFLVAYSMNRLTNCIVIDIGAGTIDICGMKGMVPTPDDQVTIKKAGDHIDKELASSIVGKYPGVQITESIACKIKEKHSFVGEPDKPVMVTLRTEGKPVEYDISEEIKSVCENIVPDIMERLDTLIMKFDPEDQEETLRNIFLAGGGSNIRGLDRMIADQLKDFGDVVVTRVNDPEFIGCDGALKLAGDIPPDQWNQIGTMFGD